MKTLIMFVGALFMLAAMAFLFYALVLTSNQINQALGGIFSIASGVLALIMLTASNDGGEVGK